MDLQQLRTFRTVARRRSFTRAAQELHLSQPAVSRQVEALEASLGASLFSRQGRRVALTEAGRRLLDYAERILELVARAERALAELHQLEAGRLTVAASTTPGGYLRPPVLAAFQERHPGLEARLTVHPSAEVEQLVLSGQADLGVAAATGAAARIHRRIHFLSLKGARLSPAALALLALARKGAPEGGEAPWRTGASRSA